MIQDSVLNMVGNTPLVQLKEIFPENHINLYGKMETFNPSGSIKDRVAKRLITEALKAKQINQNTTIIESSSGNLGVGLAMICAMLGLEFICVVDPIATSTHIKTMKAYGAKISSVTELCPNKGTFLAARITRIKHLLKTIPNSFNLNQYQNPNNPLAHQETMHEIITALNGKPLDYLFCATSTCGTLRGISEYIVGHDLKTKIIAVDAEGSVIFGYKPKPRLIPGHGAGIVPPHYRAGMEDEHLIMSDLECVIGCRRLLQTEGIFAGGSSGAGISAINRIKDRLPFGANVATIICDRGNSYLDTVYDNDWVYTHFGEVSHYWKKAAILKHQAG